LHPLAYTQDHAAEQRREGHEDSRRGYGRNASVVKQGVVDENVYDAGACVDNKRRADFSTETLKQEERWGEIVPGTE